MKKVKIVGIQGFKDKDYLLLHVVKDADSSIPNLVGCTVDNIFANKSLIPDGLKVNDYVTFSWDNVRGKAYLQGIQICK